MDRFEWLEHVTGGLVSNARAREVRRELNAHVSVLMVDLVREGWSAREAEAEAMRRMGDVRHLRDALASYSQPIMVPREPLLVGLGSLLATTGIVATLRTLTPTSEYAFTNAASAALMLPFLVGVSLIAAGLLRGDIWQHPIAALRHALRTHGVVVAAWTAVGLVVGLQPLAFHAAVTHSPVPLPWDVWREVVGPLLAVAAVLTLPSVVRRSVRDAIGAVGAGLAAFAVAATLAAFATWHLWPIPPPLGVGPNPRWDWWIIGFPWDTMSGLGIGETFRWLPNPPLPHLAHSVARLALFMTLGTAIIRGIAFLLAPAVGKAGRSVWRAITG